jgi:TolB protein
MTTLRLARPWLIAAAAGSLAGCGMIHDRITDAEPNTHETNATAPDDSGPAAQAAVAPFSLSTSGLALPGSWRLTPAEQARVAPAQAPGSNTAINLYGDVMASAMNETPASSGGGNFMQVSFSQEGADFDPDISRDGRQIVFASTQHRNTADIYIKNVESRVVTQLTNDPANDVMPRISPDGTRVAFASNRSGNWDIYVMPITGGRAIQITSSAADDLHPSWSPDGSQIVFCRMGEVSGQWELWITDVGNSGVAKFIGYGLFPEWCPAAGSGAGGADRIAFQKSRERGDRAFGIWTIDYKDGQAGNTTEVASSPIAACINPAWSPDGRWLAFATVPSPSQWAHSATSRPPSADLWMADLNGNTRISLTSGVAVNLMPAWGPDNRLFFVSDRGGNDNIWTMDTTKVIALAMANMGAGSSVASQSHAAPKHQTPIADAPGTESPSEHR